MVNVKNYKLYVVKLCPYLSTTTNFQKAKNLSCQIMVFDTMNEASEVFNNIDLTGSYCQKLNIGAKVKLIEYTFECQNNEYPVFKDFEEYDIEAIDRRIIAIKYVRDKVSDEY